MTPIRVLILSNSTDSSDLWISCLREEAFDPSWVQVRDVAAFSAAIAQHVWDIVLVDFMLPEAETRAALEMVRRIETNLPIILVSSEDREASAAEAMRAGANDYVLRNNLTRLGPLVARELKRGDAIREVQLGVPSEFSIPAAAPNLQAALQEADGRDVRSSRYISDRRRAEESLRLARFSIDNANVSMCWVRPDSTIADVNNTNCTVLGYTRDEMLKLRVADIDPGYSAAGWDVFLQSLRAAQTLTFESRHQKKDGTQFAVEITSVWLQFGTEEFIFSTSADLTERRRTEKERDELLELLELQIERMPIAYILYNAELRFSAWNPAAAALFGYTRDEILGQPYQILVHPDDRLDIEGIASRLRSGEVMAESVNKNFTKDGRTLVCEWHNTPLQDHQGKFLGVLSMTLDVTERVRAEAALRESEERLRLALAAGRMGTFDWDVNTHSIIWSDTHYELFGYPADNKFPVEFRHFADRIHPEDRVAVEQAIQQAKVLRTPYTNECRIVLPDGAVRWILGGGRFYYSQADEPVRMLGTVVDITDRAELQAELVMRDRAIQAVHQGIVITDPTLPDNPIIYVSPGFERMTGYTAAEVRGRNCRFLNGKDTDPAELVQVGAAIRAARHYTGEILNYKKDGTPFWNELSITPVRDSAGRVVQFIGIQTDATARRSLEAQLVQSQKMEAVGQLAGGVAHDFNNLLTVINGFSELALLEIPASHRLREPLVSILQAGDRATALTQQLLAFSRKTIVSPQVIDLNAAVEAVTKMLRRLIGEDIALSTVLAPLPYSVRIDPGLLEQLIINLSINSRDAMPTGGLLTIETGLVEILEAAVDCQSGMYVQLKVTDTGCGMSPEVESRIFEPFFTTKGIGNGTGLGLAMVHGIVNQAGGCVRVQSKVNAGTTFTILFPAIDAAEVSIAAGSYAGQASVGAETVILAEDEPEVRKLAKIALEMHGYTVLEADSGRQALELAKSYSDTIHLLVTDVVMPDLGGRELADAIRHGRPGLRVLYVSGYTDDAIVRHGVAAASEAFLQKPFTLLTLAQKVREVMDAAISHAPQLDAY